MTRIPASQTRTNCLLASLLLSFVHGAAQTPSQSQQEPPKGEVIFQSHGEPPASTPVQPPVQTAKDAAANATPDISDAQRSAINFTAYDLDARLAPASGSLAMRARLTVRNDGTTPLTHLALQISSSLTWQSATLVSDGQRTHLPLAQAMIETDADHTGKANEAVLTLPMPLAPGAELSLDTFYSGAIPQDATRLERIGAVHDDALKTDWDAISTDSTALRGFGDVLWYPVSSPQLFLGDGAKLFEAVGQTKLRESAASVHLRLSVDYAGDPPIAAYFCGRRAAFTAISDNPDVPVASGQGVATADFPAARLGFRIMSLFLIAAPEFLAPPLAIESAHDDSLPLVEANAKEAAAVLTDWLGPQPLSSLTILDHPGQPFEDGPLLVAPLSALGAADAVPALTHSLTHAWVQTGSPWMDDGLAQFFVLLGVERAKGRDTAISQLTDLLEPLTLSEPALEPGKTAPAGQPLPTATSELYYRRKAAAVFWMLRDIAGDDPLKFALQAFRSRPVFGESTEQDAEAFEAALEKTSGKDLHWFFDDWVFHDLGLPDLSIVEVTPRQLPATAGRTTGWLVSVSVRNDGAAVADVPVVIRSGSFSVTQRMRIAGFATVSTRIVVEAPPTQIVVNDGGTPEQRTSIHTRDVVVKVQ